MAAMIQFPSPALWHQVLSGPPVSKDQGTRNPFIGGPIGGFNEMVHAQLAKQNAIAGLQPPPHGALARAPQIQRAPEKEPRERNRNPQGQERGQQREGRGQSAPRDSEAPRVRAVWA